jgi:protein-L-isoaspartate(D-aspartate) O-methyltransferase
MNSSPALRRELEQQGISDKAVLDAISNTPRELFVSDEQHNLAYSNQALPIDCSQTISQPYMVALMTQLLQLTGTEHILEIGTGSGYQAAVLAQLAATVTTIERHELLSNQARNILDRLGYQNISFHTGDGTLGWPDGAPYDGIIVMAAAPKIPTPLFDQLKPNGKLVIPLGDETIQNLKLIEKSDGRPVITDSCDCRFVKLIGECGWEG